MTCGNVIRCPLPTLRTPNLVPVGVHSKCHLHIHRGLVFNEDTDCQFIGSRFATKWSEKHEVGHPLLKVVSNRTPHDLFHSVKINLVYRGAVDDFIIILGRTLRLGTAIGHSGLGSVQSECYEC